MPKPGPLDKRPRQADPARGGDGHAWVGSACRDGALSLSVGQMLDDDTTTVARWTTAALLVMATGLGSTGCVMVKPQERQYLSTPEMSPTTDAIEDVFHAHIEAARRAATNGHGGGGGGCGCG